MDRKIETTKVKILYKRKVLGVIIYHSYNNNRPTMTLDAKEMLSFISRGSYSLL